MTARNFTSEETINTLKAIFEKHRNERVCVLGTICAGKSTLLKQLSGYNCLDMDDELWPSLTQEETAFLNQTPWTEEMGDEIDRLAYKYLMVKPGYPLFTTVILDCEAVVYLDISDRLLMAHCEKRGESFTDAKSIKEAIESDWNAHKAENKKIFYYVMLTQ